MDVNPVHNPQNTEQEEDVRRCWICFETEADDPRPPWVQPCLCRGTAKWVHEPCLLHWINLKQRGQMSTRIKCSQCRETYIVFVPNCNALISCLRIVVVIVNGVCRVVSNGVFFGIFIWAAARHGMWTVKQIFGKEEGVNMLKRANPFARLFLPAIPAALIAFETIQWEDYLLDLLRTGSKYGVLRHILPSEAYNQVTGQRIYSGPRDEEAFAVLIERALTGGLVLPIVANVFGEVLFTAETSCWKRCILGGLCYIGIRGVLKMYYNQKTYIMKSQMRVLNHNESLG